MHKAHCMIILSRHVAAAYIPRVSFLHINLLSTYCINLNSHQLLHVICLTYLKQTVQNWIFACALCSYRLEQCKSCSEKHKWNSHSHNHASIITYNHANSDFMTHIPPMQRLLCITQLIYFITLIFISMFDHNNNTFGLFVLNDNKALKVAMWDLVSKHIL